MHQVITGIYRAVILSLTFILLHAMSFAQAPPSWLQGKFTDDYRIRYTISDTLWIQQPDALFHIIKWNLDGNYLIARNDSTNPGEKGLYTRIDFMEFTGMAPFNWGFCLTAYDAVSPEAAEKKPAPDRSNPRKGCNGFPFSRMKRTE